MKQNSNFSRIFLIIALVLIITGFTTQVSETQTKVTSPEAFFGFKLGSDRQIARWDKIVNYFELLQKESDKLKVINMGPSTMGSPFLFVIISSAENLKNLERLQEINAKISDPRGI
ncbi:MAG: peptidase M14 family protein, partial [Candidatus Aminicenantes bacterium]|nr:peptidase M14 family protein [Candidatus Aminicenantes bacterium]